MEDTNKTNKTKWYGVKIGNDTDISAGGTNLRGVLRMCEDIMKDPEYEGKDIHIITY